MIASPRSQALERVARASSRMAAAAWKKNRMAPS